MYESARYINDNLKTLVNNLNLTIHDKEKLFNLMIELGRVAKFRCRSNAAYRNFLEMVFSGLAEIKTETVKREIGTEFEVFKAVVEK